MHIVLESDRLILRRFTKDDLDNLFNLDHEPEVMLWLNGGNFTPRTTIQNEVLPMFLHYYKQLEGYGYWAAIEKTSSTFLGWFSLVAVQGKVAGDAALGYRLRRSAWGRGYGTEGSRAVIHQAFSVLGVQRVVATTYQDNIASRRVLEKSGMTLVRTYRVTSADLQAQRTYRVNSADIWDGDDVEYALSRDDWERTLRF